MQRVGGVLGVGVFADGVDVFAADGGVVEGLGEGGAGGAAEDGVVAVGAGVPVRGGGGDGGEFGTAGVAERVQVAVVGCEDGGFVEDGFARGEVGGGEEAELPDAALRAGGGGGG